jgi:acetylornithine deacetylase/succinyl-diaminopimelate desuccinylase-like protein
MTTDIDSVLSRLDGNFDAAVERLFNLLRIPSISTDPSRAEDCVRAAEWLADDLSSMGFDAGICPTEGHPMVLGHYKAADSAAPHILFYGHYDVQPPDPLELWTTPPFEPELRKHGSGDEGRIYARGAMDDKGQLMTFVEACRAILEEYAALPVSVTVLLEGEEESGSSSLGPFLKQHAGELKADCVLVCDTLMWDKQTPAITSMLRGMVAEEFTIKAANRDLHSGLYGNAAQNPNNIIAHILSSLKDTDGSIKLPGFYDGIVEPRQSLIAQWEALDFDDAGFLGDIGLKYSSGEPGRHLLEQLWTRPSCDINGIWGGYTEPGFKTVIPAEASAKVSFRLVAGQDPGKVKAAFRAFVRAQVPSDCSVEFLDHGASPAISCDTSSDFVKTVMDKLTLEFGREAAFIGCGGSIPVVESFADLLGMESILIGFGLGDDCAHSPNEKYEISSFRHGARFWARLITALV